MREISTLLPLEGSVFRSVGGLAVCRYFHRAPTSYIKAEAETVSVQHTVPRCTCTSAVQTPFTYVPRRWHHLAYLLDKVEVYVSRSVWLAIAIAQEQKQFSASQLIHRDEWGDSQPCRCEEQREERCIRAKLQEDVGNDECRTLNETNASITRTVANDLSYCKMHCEN